MRAREIMTRSVITVRPDTPVHDAAGLMSEHGITSLPVLDADNRVVGIVSEADLLRDRMPHDPRSHLRRDEPELPDPARLVGQVITKVVHCLGENADTADVATVMLDMNVRAVPIVDGGRAAHRAPRRHRDHRRGDPTPRRVRAGAEPLAGWRRGRRG
jgi:CBS domain-containing protein